jgi:hypothetical protein
VENSTAVREYKCRLHVVTAQAVVEQQCFDREEHEHRDDSTQRPRQPSTEPEDIHEGDRPKQCIKKAEAVLIVRQETRADRAGEYPQLQRRLLEEPRVKSNASRCEPIAGLEHPVDGIRVNRFITLQIPFAERNEQRGTAPAQDANQGDARVPRRCV